MRKVVRIVIAVLLAYAVQATVLPYLRVGGVMLDVMLIVLCTIGYAMGYYAGITSGLLAAVILEAVSGDLPGMISFVSVAAGGFGAWAATQARRISMPGRRGLEQNIKRYAPMVTATVLEIGKETLYVAYFYLTGMSIAWLHIGRILLAGLMVGVSSLVLMPLVAGFIRRRREDTFIVRRLERRRRRKKDKAKPLEETSAGSTPTTEKEKKKRGKTEKREKKGKGTGPSLGDLVRMPSEGGTDA